MYQIGVDFGGTKIEAAALDLSGSFLKRVRASTPKSYTEALDAVSALISQVESDLGPAASLGFGVPGSISPKTGLMRNANSIFLNGMDFKSDLETTLKRPIRLANDANCLALSEAIDGAAAGAHTVFAAILGTGCGGGVTVGGRLLEGASGIAGEWGHIALPWPSAKAEDGEMPGTECWCGLKGCLETYVSGTGLRQDYARATGHDLSGEDIIARFRAGEPAACAALERLISRLGRGLAMMVNLMDPDVIVLGGGLSNVTELYAPLADVVRQYVFSDVWSGQIRAAKWGDSSGVRGAAHLWSPADFQKGEFA